MQNQPDPTWQTTNSLRARRDGGACTVQDACKLLGDIGRSTLYVLIGAGKLTAIKLGSRTLITTASIDAFLSSLPRLGSKVEAEHEEGRR